MKYIDEFRNKKMTMRVAEAIKTIMPPRELKIMEVCGTHTQNFLRFGLDKLLPPELQLISGPGCPVCVSAAEYVDCAIAYSQDKDVVLLTFGDMLRVPGSTSSLEKEKAKGAHVKVVYSPWDSLRFAKDMPAKKIIFLAVGFETTAPTIALTLLQAKRANLKNLFFLNSLKRIPAAMAHLLKDKKVNLAGFLCPGHVSAIVGTNVYRFIPKRYAIPCAVAGFEPLDILGGIYLLIRQIVERQPGVANGYLRVVTAKGNLRAQRILAKVFRPAIAEWRGLGEIPQSGLAIKKTFDRFDVEKRFPLPRVKKVQGESKNNCRCAEVLKGLITPRQCPLFRKKCSPLRPFGPCMISQEGACNAYYKYR